MRSAEPQEKASGQWVCPMCTTRFDSESAVWEHFPHCEQNSNHSKEETVNVPTMQVPADEAKKRLKKYRDHLKRRVDEEYEAIAAGLEEMGNGRPVVDAFEAVREGGLNRAGLPNLAIARADRDDVRYVPPGWTSRYSGNGHKAGRTRFGFDGRKDRSFPTDQTNLYRTWPAPEEWRGEMNDSDHYALVPMLPPEARDAMNGQPREHFVLWEVEEWHSKRSAAEPDRDPFLLKPLGGDLHSIVHQWDLTDLERAAMRAARQDR